MSVHPTKREVHLFFFFFPGQARTLPMRALWLWYILLVCSCFRRPPICANSNASILVLFLCQPFSLMCPTASAALVFLLALPSAHTPLSRQPLRHSQLSLFVCLIPCPVISSVYLFFHLSCACLSSQIRSCASFLLGMCLFLCFLLPLSSLASGVVHVMVSGRFQLRPLLGGRRGQPKHRGARLQGPAFR